MKVKCDETPGICANCQRLHLTCEQYNGSSTAPTAVEPSQANPHGKRRRAYRSCLCCRASKSRCTGELPDCLRCTQRGLRCEYDTDTTPKWTQRIRSLSFVSPLTNSQASSDAPAVPFDQKSGTASDVRPVIQQAPSPQSQHLNRSVSPKHESPSTPPPVSNDLNSITPVGEDSHTSLDW